MGLDDRVAYQSPLPTIDSVDNTVQRWATQPPLGFMYYSGTTGATVTVGAAWNHLALPNSATTVKYDPYGIINHTLNTINIKVPGVYFFRWTIVFSGGASVAGTYGGCFTTLAGPTGQEVYYNQVEVPAAPTIMAHQSGYAVITQQDINQALTNFKFLGFNATAKNAMPTHIQMWMVSAIRPGKW